MRISHLISLASTVAALPALSVGGSGVALSGRTAVEVAGAGAGAAGAGAGAAAGAQPAAGGGKGVVVVPAAGAGAGNGTAGAGGEKKEETPKVRSDTQFNVATAVPGDNKLQAVKLPASTNGTFEVEFQGTVANSFTVTENKTPAPPPAGFTAFEGVSYIVKFTGDLTNATRVQIDYFGKQGGPSPAQAQIGRLCTETKAFVIDNKALGEFEFEVDENELALKIETNKALMNGEWGIFQPIAAAAAPAPVVAAPAPGAQPAAGAATSQNMVEMLRSLLGGNAGTPIIMAPVVIPVTQTAASAPKA